jgi:hypothetical protein
MRTMRLGIQMQTFDMCRLGFVLQVMDAYSGGDGSTQVVPLRATPTRSTRLCRASKEISERALSNAGAVAAAAWNRRWRNPGAATTGRPPVITVRNVDCLEQAGAFLSGRGLTRVAVLNMANARTPGGGFRRGCGAQEENMHRRSDLHLYLEDTSAWEHAWAPRTSGGRRSLTACRANTAFYPIPDDAVLYSRDVRVFRGPESDGYPTLSEPFSVDGECPLPSPGPPGCASTPRGRSHRC